MKTKGFTLFVFIVTQSGAFAQVTGPVQHEAKKRTQPSPELCKYLHQNPELSFRKIETLKKWQLI